MKGQIEEKGEIMRLDHTKQKNHLQCIDHRRLDQLEQDA